MANYYLIVNKNDVIILQLFIIHRLLLHTSPYHIGQNRNQPDSFTYNLVFPINKKSQL